MGLQNGLRALVLIFILHTSHSKITFPIDSPSPAEKAREYVRSLEIADIQTTEKDSDNEIDVLDRKLKDDENWNEWNSPNKNKRWSFPNEKTISVQLLDDEPYHHGRPSWPHDEYLVGYFNLNRTPTDVNGTLEGDNLLNIPQEEIRKYYEWQRLQPRPSPSAFIGPGFYDVGASSNNYGTSLSPDYYRYQPTHQAISDASGNLQSTASNSESVPGTPSESTTNTRHFPPYSPYDFYKRRRLRLQIHPGLIAAPLAGLAAFGAASALTSKPLLFELGYVRNKPDFIGQGGWGWAGTGAHGYRPYPPFYPPPNPPPFLAPIGTAAIHPPVGGISHAHAQGHGVPPAAGGPIYPVLTPHRGRPNSDRSSWWNPFSALTPRLRKFVNGAL